MGQVVYFGFCVPAMLPVSLTSLRPHVQKLHAKLVKFMEDHVYPMEPELRDYSSSDQRWTPHPRLEELKVFRIFRLFVYQNSDHEICLNLGTCFALRKLHGIIWIDIT